MTPQQRSARSKPMRERIERLRETTQTAEEFVTALVPLYREDMVEVARICDEEAGGAMTEPLSAQSGKVVHGLLQTARGYVTDGYLDSIDRALAEAVETAKDIEAERDRYRRALERLDHLLAAPGGLSVPEMQTEGRRIIEEALNGS